MNPLHMPSFAPRFLPSWTRAKRPCTHSDRGSRRETASGAGPGGGGGGRAGAGRGGGALCATMRGIATHGARGHPPGYKSVTTWRCYRTWTEGPPVPEDSVRRPGTRFRQSS
jgi:hypothetical protein